MPQNVGAERNDNHQVAHERPLHAPLSCCPRTDGPRLGPPPRLVKLGHRFCSLSHAGRMVFSVDRRASMAEGGKQLHLPLGPHGLRRQNGELRATAARGQGRPWISPSHKVPLAAYPAFRVVLGPLWAAGGVPGGGVSSVEQSRPDARRQSRPSGRLCGGHRQFSGRTGLRHATQPRNSTDDMMNLRRLVEKTRCRSVA